MNNTNIQANVGTHTSAVTGTDGTYTYYCDASYNLLLALDPGTSGAVINANQVSVKVDAAPFSTNTPLGFIDNPTGGVFLNREWEVDPATQPSAGNVRVKFFFTNAEYTALVSAASALSAPTTINAPQELQFYKVLIDKAVAFPNLGTGINDVNVGEAQFIDNSNVASTSTWVYESLVNSNHAAIYDVVSFSGGGGGAGGMNQNLPVELLSFKGELAQAAVALTWSTGSEYNNKGFEVERSQDGRSWKALAFVAGAGTTIESQTYNWLDTAPNEGVNYYRLKQLDFDGVFEYSDIIAILVPTAYTDKLIVTPNPTNGKVTYRLSDKTPIEHIQLFDANGNLLKNSTLITNELDLPTGTYTLLAISGGKRFIAVVVKQ